eukprot:3183913-Amphidinium_carterae.2
MERTMRVFDAIEEEVKTALKDASARQSSSKRSRFRSQCCHHVGVTCLQPRRHNKCAVVANYEVSKDVVQVLKIFLVLCTCQRAAPVLPAPHIPMDHSVHQTIGLNLLHSVDEVLLSSLMEACIRAGRGDLLKPRHPGHSSPSFSWVTCCQNCNTSAPDDTNRQPNHHLDIDFDRAVLAVSALNTGLELIHEIQADEKGRGVLNAVIYCSVLKGFSHQKKFDSAWVVYEDIPSAARHCVVRNYKTTKPQGKCAVDYPAFVFT